MDIEKFKSDELSSEKLTELISQKRSFQVVAVVNLSSVVNEVEGAIEKNNLTCRVYTEYRSASLASALIPTGITQAFAFYSAMAIAVHNIATFNPDYEIAKNKLAGTVTVLYKKS